MNKLITRFNKTVMRSAFCVLCLGFLLGASFGELDAQNFDIRGIVLDDTGEALPGGTIVAITAGDSTLVSFGTTRKTGEFQLRRVPAGDYIVKASFVGFKVHVENVTVVDKDVDMGTFQMELQIEELGELVVTEERIPIIVKADTVVYDASAFQVRAYANVEELLQRLPGIEVSSDGTITAQGEEVQKILVDGKEFFGDDPKIASQNIQAQAVKKIEVFDKKSDAAEFTGVDDGQEEKTINLELKDEFRQGYFGSLEGGYGPDNHYEGKVNINRFNPTTQLALIGNGSDVSSGGFSNGEFQALSGFRGGGGGRLNFGSNRGLSETLTGGLNLAHDFRKDSKLSTSYFANYADNLVDGTIQQQQLIGDTFGALTNQLGVNSTQNLNHRVNLDLEHDFNPLNSLRLRVRGNLSDSDGLNDSESVVTGRGNQTNSEFINQSMGDRIGGSVSSTYFYRFAGSTRNIVADVSYELSDNEDESDFSSATEFLRDGNLLSRDEIDQLQRKYLGQLFPSNTTFLYRASWRNKIPRD